MTGGRAALLPFAVACLATCTAPNPTFMETTCDAGSRQCVVSQGGSYPVVCTKDDGGRMALVQERCPVSAECQAGLCAAPVGAKRCTRQPDCEATQVCVPLVGEQRTLQSFCLPLPIAERAPQDPCSVDKDCKSYFCLPSSSGNRCLKTCAAAEDCKIPDECRSLNITVTGVAGAIQTCLPRG